MDGLDQEFNRIAREYERRGATAMSPRSAAVGSEALPVGAHRERSAFRPRRIFKR